MLAVALTALLTAAPLQLSLPSLGAADASEIVMGMDASEMTRVFLPRPPQIDPSLLVYAPTSPDVAFSASLTAALTGLATTTAFALLLGFNPMLPVGPALIGLFGGMAVTSFGANVGDLMNGDTSRFVRNGLLRMASLLVLVFAGPYGALLWLGWVALDVVNARWAPARWVEREFGGAEVPVAVPRAEPGPLLKLAF